MDDASAGSSDYENDDNLVLLVEQLGKIDENSSDAELNAVSISDNNGGHIEL